MKKNLLGQKFGNWTVIAEAEPFRSPNGKAQCAGWLCQCICGKTKIRRPRELIYGKGYDCGCNLGNIVENKKMNCLEYHTRQCKSFLFDECDKETALSVVWGLSHGYVNNSHIGRFHRVILKVTDPKIQVDHINGNRLDNRRCNLRVVDNQHNCWNSTIRKDNTSGHKNISWNKRRKKWRVRISKDGKIYEWNIKDYDEACKIAEEKHKELFGEYSFYNREG